MTDLREVTLLGVSHPEYIDGGAWQRVDHPVLDPLTSGNADYGWEGDDRLVVYLHLESETFVLWRLEHDNEYRAVAQLAGSITAENINRLCKRLVEVDTRRGFNAYEDVVGAQEAKDRAEAVAHDAWVADWSDKFLFGLAQSHLPGIDITRRSFTGFGGK